MTYKKKMALAITAMVLSALLLLGGSIGIFVAYMTASYDSYKGDFVAQYTEAVYSLLDASGYWVDGEPILDPFLSVRETDAYGRTLFAYSEYRSVSTVALMILQKSDDTYAYYYPDYNFTATKFERSKSDGNMTYVNYLSDENCMDTFSDEQIDKLKQENDWNKEFDETKCVKRQLTTRKPDYKITKTQTKALEELSKKAAAELGYESDIGVLRYATHFDTDAYERKIFYARCLSKNDDAESVYFNIVVMLKADDTYDDACLLVLKDSQNYQAELKAFKSANSWNCT